MKERLRHLLNQPLKGEKEQTGFTPAAVLVIIFEKEGQHHLLFTRRTDFVATHKGQISFPGGVREGQDESLLATAIRETSEELGIRPEDIEVLGGLSEEVIPVTRFVVTPFVGLLPHPYELKPKAIEVEEVLEVPLGALLSQKGYVEGAKQLPSPFPAYEFQENIIWGATARILHRFLNLIRE